MMVARWSIDAKFGHKPDVVNSLSQWFNEINSQIDWVKGKCCIVTGSVGALESQDVSEIIIESLTELNNYWNKLGDIPEHAAWSKELAPHIVSGNQKREIFRTVE